MSRRALRRADPREASGATPSGTAPAGCYRRHCHGVVSVTFTKP